MDLGTRDSNQTTSVLLGRPPRDSLLSGFAPRTLRPIGRRDTQLDVIRGLDLADAAGVNDVVPFVALGYLLARIDRDLEFAIWVKAYRRYRKG